MVSLPGRGEVFVRDSGGPPAAPAVLLLHGWTASADLNFFPAYDCLAGTYRVIAPDARGHGRGMRSAEPFRLEDCADDAAALLDLAGADRVIAVGYSMGGPIGMLLARRHPGRVNALVMQATALEWRDAAYERMVWRLLSVMELGLRLGTTNGVVERFLRLTTEGQRCGHRPHPEYLTARIPEPEVSGERDNRPGPTGSAWLTFRSGARRMVCRGGWRRHGGTRTS